MSRDQFTDPDTTHEQWVDVRMRDPDQGEWSVDVVVAGNRVEYVDLRVRPDLLSSFIECLVDDVGAERAGAILSRVADRNGIDLDSGAADTDGEDP